MCVAEQNGAKAMETYVSHRPWFCDRRYAIRVHHAFPRGRVEAKVSDDFGEVMTLADHVDGPDGVDEGAGMCMPSEQITCSVKI